LVVLVSAMRPCMNASGSSSSSTTSSTTTGIWQHLCEGAPSRCPVHGTVSGKLHSFTTSLALVVTAAA
jgi:hypothetical protein